MAMTGVQSSLWSTVSSIWNTSGNDHCLIHDGYPLYEICVMQDQGALTLVR
jgi:hypothetical protein